MLEMWSNFAKTGDAFNIEYPLLDIEQNTTRYKIQLKHKSKMEYYPDDDREDTVPKVVHHIFSY